MTDKEIFEKLEAEIERLENYENESVTSSDTRFGWIHGKTFALTSIRVLLDSMKKEPKECMYSKGNYTDEDRKVLCEDCKEKCAYAIAGVISTNAQIKKEPVSEDLEQAIDAYLSTYFGGDKEKRDWPFLKKMAIYFAAWQKQQMMAKAVDGIVHRFDGCGVASVHYNDPNGIPMAYFIPSEGLSAGDKVKIITIKED